MGKILTGLLCCVVLCGSAFAAEKSASTEALLKEGKALLDQGQAEQALPILQQAYEADSDNPKANFYYGQAAFALGDYESAAMAYERALMLYPKSSRIKLELARVYNKMGADEMAKAMLESVLADNPPAQVRENVEAYLNSVIHKSAPTTTFKKHNFHGNFSAGIVYDTNADFATYHKYVESAIGTFTIAKDEREDEDGLLQQSAALSYEYRFDEKYSLKATGVAFNQYYFDRDELNLNFVGLHVGPKIRHERFQAETAFTIGRMNEDHDRYMKTYGVQANAIVPMSKQWGIIGRLKFEDRKFYSERARDADTYDVQVGPSYILGRNRFDTRLCYRHEEAEADYLCFNEGAFTLRYTRKLPCDMEAYGSYRFAVTNYKERRNLWNDKRDDRHHQFGAGISKQLNCWLKAQADYSYTNADSNVDLYDYDRHTIGFTMTASF